MNIREKWEAVKKAKVCFQCLSPNHRRLECKAKKCGVEGCRMSHHRMLHRYPNENTSPQGDEGGKDAQITTVSTVNALACAYLKIIPVELHGPRGKVRTTALLDEGSTMTLIEEWMAQKLAPRGRKEGLRIEAVGGKRINDDSSYRLNVKIKGIYSSDLEEISVQTIKSLNLAPQSVSRELLQRCSHLTPIKDELMYERSKPTILIGQDNWHLIVTRELVSGGKNLPVASLTKLGWVLHGHISGGIKPIKIVNHISTKKEEDMDKLIKDYFSLESLGVSARKPVNDPEERALNILNKTVRRIPNNRYETALLWRTDNECLPSNRAQVESRLFNIEKKLDKNSELKKGIREAN
ncbi:unnamed protein product [Parnassius apollo]|uniref:(apollo) hypothetical protein n=1 Tax=Parnassius apollo TaxID=110799 RepID=A0A8S3WPF9_PARAO|nr:unnamed protein product [Parnassius apollo]